MASENTSKDDDVLRFQKGTLFCRSGLIRSAVSPSGMPAASAAPAASGWLTICRDAQFQGCTSIGSAFRESNLREENNEVGLGFQDSISSIRNDTGKKMCFFVDSNFRGAMLPLAPHTEINDLSQFNLQAFQDSITSFGPC
ncbi:hypothetical protein ACIO1C_24685 [Streptomyces sp. NPDC087420]|uniref:hypothetical protein n=1 Tax=Streptomyces sp. NPDC087420 TaxID=3365785 RepID=UPI0038369C74